MERRKREKGTRRARVKARVKRLTHKPAQHTSLESGRRGSKHLSRTLHLKELKATQQTSSFFALLRTSASQGLQGLQ